MNSRNQTAFQPSGPAALRTLSTKTAVGALVLLCAVIFPALSRATDNRAPDVPEELIPQDAKVHFHGFGVGVQMYTWDGLKWAGPVPDAKLFDNDGNIVADHFAGPTWRSNSGSQVVGKPIVPIIVDTNAIPWVLLEKVTAQGPGIFANTTHIQRVNTTGGLAPKAPGAFVGQEASVPYTADYFFYRPSNN